MLIVNTISNSIQWCLFLFSFSCNFVGLVSVSTWEAVLSKLCDFKVTTNVFKLTAVVFAYQVKCKDVIGKSWRSKVGLFLSDACYALTNEII